MTKKSPRKERREAVDDLAGSLVHPRKRTANRTIGDRFAKSSLCKDYLRFHLELHVHIRLNAACAIDDFELPELCATFQYSGLGVGLSTLNHDNISADIADTDITALEIESAHLNDPVLVSIVQFVQKPHRIICVPSFVRLMALKQCVVHRINTLEALTDTISIKVVNKVPIASLKGRRLPAKNGKCGTSGRELTTQNGNLIRQPVKSRPKIVGDFPNLNSPNVLGLNRLSIDDVVACLLVKLDGDCFSVDFLDPLNRMIKGFNLVACNREFKARAIQRMQGIYSRQEDIHAQDSRNLEGPNDPDSQAERCASGHAQDSKPEAVQEVIPPREEVASGTSISDHSVGCTAKGYLPGSQCPDSGKR